MPKNWSKATPEQLAERNRKRRERYASMDSEAKKIYIEKESSRPKTARTLKPTVPLRIMLTMPDGSKKELTNPDWIKWFKRKKPWIERHKANFMKKVERIKKWRDAGGLFPWPNLQDKAEVTRLFVRICHKLGRRCCQCGDWKVFDFSWRLTRKDDFLAFVPFQKEAYEKVLRNPNDYCFYCIKCAFDLRIYTFFWIFSPKSPRNDPKRTSSIVGDKYRNWNHIWPIMYPSTHRALADRIRAKEIKSLTCGITMPDGTFKETFVRKHPFYSYVGVTPRDSSLHVLDQARHFYQRLRPDVDCSFWGWGYEGGRDLSYPKCGWDALGDDTRRFLESEPATWEKLKHQQ